MTERLQYPDVDPRTVEPYYSRHVEAMTAEGLHAKSDIAAQLAWRDAEIARLTAELAADREPRDVCWEAGH